MDSIMRIFISIIVSATLYAPLSFADEKPPLPAELAIPTHVICKEITLNGMLIGYKCVFEKPEYNTVLKKWVLIKSIDTQTFTNSETIAKIIQAKKTNKNIMFDPITNNFFFQKPKPPPKKPPTPRYNKESTQADGTYFYVYADEHAEEILDRAENNLLEFTQEWFGKAPKCDDQLCGIITRSKSKNNVREASTLRRSSIIKSPKYDNLFLHTLAHEVAHLGIQKELGNIPRIFNEGIATFYDNPERLEKFMVRMREYAQKRNWPPLADFLMIDSLTDDKTEKAIYPMGYYLIRYLTEKLEKRTDTGFPKLMVFIKDIYWARVDAQKRDQDVIPTPVLNTITRRHYDITFRQLEANFHIWIMQDLGVK